MDITQIESYLETALLVLTPKIILAIIILVIGFKVAKIFNIFIDKYLTKKEIDISLKSFLLSFIKWTLRVVILLAAASSLGIETTSFLTILGSAGLAIGLALQGSLSNFAGGVIILLLKPFKVGDVITAQGFTGTVAGITVFSTELKTPDNQVIIIPNGSLANSPVININLEPTRRVDFVFGIGYQDNIDSAKSTIQNIVNNDQRILKDPVVAIFVGELADSSVNLTVRVWVNTPDYWDVKAAITEAVKKEFDKNKISIPFPQQDVHIIQA